MHNENPTVVKDLAGGWAMNLLAKNGEMDHALSLILILYP